MIGLKELNRDVAVARRALSDSAERLRPVAEPHILLSYLSLLQAEWTDAFRFAKAAIEHADECGVAWDKRLMHQQWRSAAARLAEWSTAALRTTSD